MEWVHIYTAQGDAEAVVVQSKLESDGIKCRLAKESVGNIYKINMDGLGEVKVYVPFDQVEDAKESLKKVDEPCGKANPI